MDMKGQLREPVVMVAISVLTVLVVIKLCSATHTHTR